MKLPIVAYGDPVLRKVCQDINQDYPELKKLISDMFDTMYAAYGVGLAAPQIGLPIRLFIVDTGEDEDGKEGFKRVFINARILEEKGEPWAFTEGCLSIPEIREDVMRKPVVVVEYYDENWELHEEELSGMPARVVQHEYDHIEGKLFTDTLSLLRKRMLKSKLDAISKGDIRAEYKMKFPQQRNKKR
ncbi:peptide deformylase [Pedobacter antarcticus]|uniref:Peptide deformylase n=2 Tax=Pedobacter antarcticus TaxID=34086 RepID=A0A081PM93_9SPHI|nr:peptide deformylase [Pedobacter antarcticus]KEQ31816.1 peptide deformylase [Pedobacter antarcticus 4BY]SDM76110.1 peptide deformylase [Pedobacter antarcticus]SFE71785.1 peptide deformylase [Pedobacter antarcticus]